MVLTRDLERETGLTRDLGKEKGEKGHLWNDRDAGHLQCGSGLSSGELTYGLTRSVLRESLLANGHAV